MMGTRFLPLLFLAATAVAQDIATSEEDRAVYRKIESASIREGLWSTDDPREILVTLAEYFEIPTVVSCPAVRPSSRPCYGGEVPFASILEVETSLLGARWRVRWGFLLIEPAPPADLPLDYARARLDPAPGPDEWPGLVLRLNAGSHADRERAHARLLAAGPRVLEFLAGADRGDPGVDWRVQSISASIREGERALSARPLDDRLLVPGLFPDATGDLATWYAREGWRVRWSTTFRNRRGTRRFRKG